MKTRRMSSWPVASSAVDHRHLLPVPGSDFRVLHHVPDSDWRLCFRHADCRRSRRCGFCCRRRHCCFPVVHRRRIRVCGVRLLHSPGAHGAETGRTFWKSWNFCWKKSGSVGASPCPDGFRRRDPPTADLPVNDCVGGGDCTALGHGIWNALADFGEGMRGESVCSADPCPESRRHR